MNKALYIAPLVAITLLAAGCNKNQNQNNQSTIETSQAPSTEQDQRVVLPDMYGENFDNFSVLLPAGWHIRPMAEDGTYNESERSRSWAIGDFDPGEGQDYGYFTMTEQNVLFFMNICDKQRDDCKLTDDLIPAANRTEPITQNGKKIGNLYQITEKNPKSMITLDMVLPATLVKIESPHYIMTIMQSTDGKGQTPGLQDAMARIAKTVQFQ